MRQYGRMTTGLLLIALGVLALLGNIGLGDVFGGAIVAVIGILFLVVHYIGRQEWAIYPGAFTTPVGIVVFLTTRGLNMDVWWPLFVAAPGVSFLFLRANGEQHKWAIYPGVIVVLMAGVMFAFSSGALSWLYMDVVGKIWPVALILVGLVMILKSFGARNAGPTEPR